MITTEYLVEGMTCAHCVASVAEELTGLDAVDSVDVVLRVGGLSSVTISSPAPIDGASVREAIDEAGYTVSPASS